MIPRFLAWVNKYYLQGQGSQEEHDWGKENEFSLGHAVFVVTGRLTGK